MHVLTLLADRPALASGLTILRLSLHVLAATIWVGGQFVLAGLLPTVRGLGDTAPRQVAKAFGRLSWPAYWILIVTGFWNYAAVNHVNATSGWNAVFGIKMVCVVAAGVATLLHTKASAPKAKGIFAAVAALTSVGALVLGIALAG